MWLEQVYGNHDYDMTAVLHVEPRDIVNYANPDYYWQYDSPEVQELIAAAKVNPDPDEADRAAEGGGPPDLRGLAGRLADPRRRPHGVDDRRHRLPDRRHRLAVRRLGDHGHVLTPADG